MKMIIYLIPLVLSCGILQLGCMEKASKGSIQTAAHPSTQSEEMAQDSTITKLIDQLASTDGATREFALQKLIQKGSESVPLLTQELKSTYNQKRGFIMQALGMIGDTSSITTFQKSLKDSDAKVRAMAAQGLVKLRHPDALDALITTIHDYGDETSPFTTSAYSLIDYGTDALPKIVPLLSDSSVYTRKMGYRILTQILTTMQEYENKWKELSAEMGNYNPEGEPDEREASVKKWKKWVDSLSNK